MPADQVVCLQHADSFADRHHALEKGELQSSLRRLATGPGVILLYEDVVVDIPDRQRTVLAQACHDLADFAVLHVRKPSTSKMPVTTHHPYVVAEIIDVYVRECVRPVFKDGFVGRLRALQM